MEWSVSKRQPGSLTSHHKRYHSAKARQLIHLDILSWRKKRRTTRHLDNVASLGPTKRRDQAEKIRSRPRRRSWVLLGDLVLRELLQHRRQALLRPRKGETRRKRYAAGRAASLGSSSGTSCFANSFSTGDKRSSGRSCSTKSGVAVDVYLRSWRRSSSRSMDDHNYLLGLSISMLSDPRG